MSESAKGLPAARSEHKTSRPSGKPLPRPEAGGVAEDLPAGRAVRVLANPTDVHGVYADHYAWELALKCIETMRPDVVCWGNDAMDCGTISTYSRLGELPSLAVELADEKRRRLQLKQAAPGAQMWWITDNHVMERYLRYMYSRAAEVADVEAFRFANIIDFPADHIVEELLAGTTLRVIHGTYVRKWPGASVVAHILDDPLNRRERVIHSIMMGHVHRFAHVSLDNGIKGLERGCLQDLRPEYLAKQRRGSNWTHGMGFARYGADWSQIIPARFTVLGNHLVCRLEGVELRVKLGRGYSGR